MHAQATAEAPAATAPAAEPPPATAPSIGALAVKIVSDTDPEARRQAAVEILQAASPEGTKALLEVFAAKNGEAAKIAVCRAIADTGTADPAFKQPLLALLERKEPAVREAAMAALAGYHDDAEVERRLKDLDAQFALQLLSSQIGELYALLPTDAERAERLQLWLGHPSAFVRQAALNIVHQAVKKRKEPAPAVLQKIRGMLADPSVGVRSRLVEVLRDLSKLEDAALLKSRLSRESAPEVRELIYHALGAIREPGSFAACVNGLDDPVDAVAARAADAVAELVEYAEPAPDATSQAAAVDRLLARSQAGIPDAALRKSVTDALASIADARSLPVLTNHASSDESPAVRQAALRGIGRIGEPGQVDLVIQRLAAEQDPGIRETAVEALGALGSSLAHLKPLRDRLDPAVERSAAVQQKAWLAYRTLFSKLPPKEQQQAIDDAPAEAIRLAADAQLSQELRTSVASRLLTVATELGKSDAKAALALVDKLLESVPPERLGSDLAAQAGKVRASLQQATRPAGSQPAS